MILVEVSGARGGRKSWKQLDATQAPEDRRTTVMLPRAESMLIVAAAARSRKREQVDAG